MTDPNTDEKLVRTWTRLPDSDRERSGLPEGTPDPFSFFSNENGDSDS